MPGGGIQRAKKALLPARRMFPGEVLIPYNLACYECQLGHFDEAIELLQSAVKNGDRRSVLALAEKDVDLEPLWDRLESL